MFFKKSGIKKLFGQMVLSTILIVSTIMLPNNNLHVNAAIEDGLTKGKDTIYFGSKGWTYVGHEDGDLILVMKSSSELNWDDETEEMGEKIKPYGKSPAYKKLNCEGEDFVLNVNKILSNDEKAMVNPLTLNSWITSEDRESSSDNYFYLPEWEAAYKPRNNSNKNIVLGSGASVVISESELLDIFGSLYSHNVLTRSVYKNSGSYYPITIHRESNNSIYKTEGGNGVAVPVCNLKKGNIQFISNLELCASNSYRDSHSFYIRFKSSCNGTEHIKSKVTYNDSEKKIYIDYDNSDGELYLKTFNTSDIARNYKITGASKNIELSYGDYYIYNTLKDQIWLEKKVDSKSITAWAKMATEASLVEIDGTVEIGGEAKVGKTLTAIYTGNAGTNIKYQWYADGSEISGATSETYTIAGDCQGKTITVKVTGTGTFKGSRESSSTGEVAKKDPEAIDGSITIDGELKEGQTLTANYSGNAVNNVEYKWYSADSAEGAWTVIGGATSKEYTLTSSDVGKYIKAEVIGKSGFTGTLSEVTGAKIKVAKIDTHESTGGTVSGSEDEIASGIAGKIGDPTGETDFAAGTATLMVKLSSVESTPDDTVLENMTELAKNDGYELGTVFDITLAAKFSTGGTYTSITETANDIEVEIDVPSELRSNHRTYAILRKHGTDLDILSASYNSSNHKLKFKTDKFSLYGIIYSDNHDHDDNVEEEEEGEDEHFYSFYQVRRPSTLTDFGTQVGLCIEHGDSSEEEPINYDTLMKDTVKRINSAAPNGIVTLANPIFNTLNNEVMDALKARPDVFLSFKFMYNQEVRHVVLIGPILDTDVYEYYGPQYLLNRYEKN